MTGKTYIFTLSAGRTGTAYLAELLSANLADADVHHELLGFDQFGVNTPDLSHMTLFNSNGLTPEVKTFWDQKLSRIAAGSQSIYGETSHVLAKAGLLECLDPLLAGGRVYVVALKRDWFQLLCSYRNRSDFMNKGNLWLWYLDPDYPKKLVDPANLSDLGMPGYALWYLAEMDARTEYYRQLMGDRITIIDATLPEILTREGAAALFKAMDLKPRYPTPVIPAPQNESRQSLPFPDGEAERIKAFIRRISFDPVATAKAFIEGGQRLG